jgi:hypothetical protein
MLYYQTFSGRAFRGVENGSALWYAVGVQLMLHTAVQLVVLSHNLQRCSVYSIFLRQLINATISHKEWQLMLAIRCLELPVMYN